jgi:hypothetical protein
MVSSGAALAEVVAGTVQKFVSSVSVSHEAMEDLPGSPHDAASASGGYSSDSSADPVDVSKLDPSTLKARIKAQVEYYFSQQNLSKDAYMLAQMNADGYISLEVISKFKKVRHLTEDVELLVEAVSGSSVVELSEDRSMLKTSWRRPARTTIILRDVPEGTVESDVQQLFDGTSFGLVSARSDVGQTWFVTMASEADAKDAVLHLLGKALKGEPVKARVKSESLRPSVSASAAPFTPSPQVQQQVAAAQAAQQQGYPYGYQAMGYGQMPGGYNQMGWSSTQPYAVSQPRRA